MQMPAVKNISPTFPTSPNVSIRFYFVTKSSPTHCHHALLSLRLAAMASKLVSTRLWATPPPPPPQDRRAQRRYEKEQRQAAKEADKGKPGYWGMGGKINLILAMTRDSEQREVHALKATVIWGLSLFIIGIIFIGLSASGTFPPIGGIANMKYVGVYYEYIIKYALYAFAGLLGMGAAILANRSINVGKSTVWYEIIILIALLIALATIGMSIHLDVKSNDFETSPWWCWLILVVIIIQRLIFALACGMSIYTLRLHAKKIASSGHNGNENANESLTAADTKGKSVDDAFIASTNNV